MQKVWVFEFKSNIIRKNGRIGYEYICTHDPTGNKIGQSLYVRRKDRNRIFQVLGDKIIRYYVGQCSAKKYQEQMVKYKNGKLKSKPNGRSWCLVKEDVWCTDYGSTENLYRQLRDF